MSSDAGPGRREVAQRLFAAEFDDATLSYSESDEERAPNYVVTPTGVRVNRLFAVGVFTEVEEVSDDVLRARVVDPSGAFVTYAGQYQPDEMAFLERTTPPAFLALTGKARTFEPDDSDRVYTSVRPESINEVDADTRDRWVVSTAETTLRRLAVMREALDMDARGDELTETLGSRGVPPALAAGVPRAIEHYGTTPAYLEAVRRLAVDALEVVAGEREEVRSLDVAPGEGGDAELGPLPEAPFDEDAAATDATADVGAASADAAADAEAEGETEPETGAEPPAEPETATESSAADEAEPSAGDEAEPTAAERESTAHEPEAVDVGGGGAEVDADATGSGEGALAESDAADELGEFEPTEGASADAVDREATAEGDEPEASQTGVDETEMYELDDDERRELEAQFDTGFSTGNEVSDPGEAGIETPDPESPVEAAEGVADDVDTPGADEAREAVPDAESEPTPTDDAAATAEEPSAADADADTDAAAEGDADLESAAVEIMDELGDGDGADRERVVAALVDRRGADPGAAEEAIQDALMSGRCYEAGEGTLKPI